MKIFRLGENLIVHAVKVLSICQHVIEDVLPAQVIIFICDTFPFGLLLNLQTKFSIFYNNP